VLQIRTILFVLNTLPSWKMKDKELYESVWDAISDTPLEAANLKAKSELMHKLINLINRRKWTQVVAAKHCGLTHPRLNDLLNGRISHFSLDALVNIAAALGQKVHIDEIIRTKEKYLLFC